MTLRPEQIKAREYFQQKGTLLPAAQIHERVSAAFAAMEKFMEGVIGEEARARALPGEWTVQEVVDHLIETHRPSLDELRDLLDNRRPAGGPIPASLQSADPMARRFPDLLGELRTVHAEILGVLSAAPDRMTDARAPIIMVINVKEPDGREAPLHWVEELDWKAYAVTAFRLHELDHLNQAKKTLRAARAPR
jgi:DinB family protein